MERMTIKALIVIDVHAKEVVKNLRDNNCRDENEFSWTSQLRYYWEEKNTLRVKMVTAILPYAYEYLGNTQARHHRADRQVLSDAPWRQVSELRWSA